MSPWRSFSSIICRRLRTYQKIKPAISETPRREPKTIKTIVPALGPLGLGDEVVVGIVVEAVMFPVVVEVVTFPVVVEVVLF